MMCNVHFYLVVTSGGLEVLDEVLEDSLSRQEERPFQCDSGLERAMSFYGAGRQE